MDSTATERKSNLIDESLERWSIFFSALNLSHQNLIFFLNVIFLQAVFYWVTLLECTWSALLQSAPSFTALESHLNFKGHGASSSCWLAFCTPSCPLWTVWCPVRLLTLFVKLGAYLPVVFSSCNVFFLSRNRARCSERDTALVVTETLQFLFLMESLWPKARRPLSVTARWCRLALVFLAGKLHYTSYHLSFTFISTSISAVSKCIKYHFFQALTYF